MIFTDGMTAQPIPISDVGSGVGGYLGAKAADAAASWPIQRLADIAELRRAEGKFVPFMNRDLADVSTPQERGEMLTLPEARDKLKGEGLDHKELGLTTAGIAAPALDIMIARAKAKREREATIERGPNGILTGALGVGTSFLVGAVDPLNIASGFIPVVGQARYANMMASPGMSTVARAAVRTRVGALEGAVGQAMLEPIEAYATSQEGGDYTMASALHSIMFGAALGSSLRTGGGAIADVIRMRRDRPLYPFDVGEPGSTHPAWDDLSTLKPQEPMAARPESPYLPGRTVPFEDVVKAGRSQWNAPKAPEIGAATGEVRTTPPGDKFAAGKAAINAFIEGQKTNEWIDVPEGKIYLRQGKRPGIGKTLEVPNVSFEQKGTGAFTEYLKFIEDKMLSDSKFDAVYIENIANDRLAAFLQKRAYVRKEDMAGTPSMFMQKSRLELLERTSAAPRPSPTVEALADLPPRAKEDLTRAAIAALHDGQPVKVAEVLDAVSSDPRIKESLDLVNRPEARASARRVGDDVVSQLQAAGMDEAQARQNGTLMAARYAARAQRLGRDAHELYQADGVAVQRGDRATGQAGGMAHDQAKRTPPGPDLFSQREAEGQGQLPGTERIGAGELAQRRADEPLKPGVAQKPLDIGLFGDDAKQKTLFQSAPTAPNFFSQVLRTIETGKLGKGSPDQWLATIKNTPGVKAEELEWLGLADWLKSQKGAVTKEQVAEYVRANQIEVKEVSKGKAGLSEAEQSELDALRQRERQDSEQLSREDWDRVAALEHKEAYGGETKFSRYQLPGGENYRELLLTLPSRKESLLPHERASAVNVAKNEALDFRSPHWDEPNVLAHVRFNDRTINGKRTLMTEEIQSDWHQQGRTKGYSGPVDRQTMHDLELARDAALKRWEELSANDASAADAFRAYQAADQSYADYRIARDQGVPDAPFKTTWPELSLKRMIRYAAENGYDQVAWTPGHVQAERYDLSKQISRVVLHDNTSGGIGHPRMEGPFENGNVIAFDHSGREVINKRVTPQELPDVIGKEVADKLLNVEPKRSSYAGLGVRARSLEGLDLKVGGEGMSGFYDKILPAAANKLGKKYGARVGEADLRHDGPGALVDAQIDRVRQELVAIDEKIDVAQRAGARAEQLGLARDRLELESDLEGLLNRPQLHEPVTVHTLPITPELRDAAVSQGFPLFQRSGESEPRGRIELSENKAIISLFHTADKSTFLHEAGHLFLDQLARDAQLENVPQALKDDLGSVLRWLGVDRVEDIGVPQHEQWARGFEQYLASGEAPSNALVKAFQAFKEWLGAIYRSLRDLGEPLPDDIRGVMDRMLATDAEIAERRAPKSKEEAWAELARQETEPAPAAPAKAEHPASLQPQDIPEGLVREAPKAPEIPESEIVTTEVKAKAPRGPAARPPEQWSLLEFLASKGGIDAGDPLAGDVRSLIGKNNKLIPGFGNLIRKGGMSLDRARAAAVEAGYLFDIGDVTLAQHDVTPDMIPGAVAQRAIELKLREGLDSVEAFDRAMMEAMQDVADRETAGRIGDVVPGWDAPHDGGSVSAPGRTAAAVERPKGQGAGAGVRGAGENSAGQPEKLTPVSASAKAAAKAEALARAEYDALVAAGEITPEDKIALDTALAAIDAESSMRARVVREGAGCLAGGFGFAAAAAGKPKAPAVAGIKANFQRDAAGKIAGVQFSKGA